MKSGIRTRIALLSRLALLGLTLVAGLVAITSRSPAAPEARPVATSAIHAPPRWSTEQANRGVDGPIPSPPASFPTPVALPATPAPVPSPIPSPTVDVSNRIGILAGHWGYDTGAVCNDGLREVDITHDIAQRVATRLQALGYEVDILQEQDPDIPAPPLQNYRAAAFVSLHVDSCIPDASGFKVARWAFSQIPEVEDRLVTCLEREYAATTGLARHDSSVTIDMWNYYAFREIAKPTPGAIIELGFMSGDRWVLVGQPDLAAQGVVNGILCFLKGP